MDGKSLGWVVITYHQNPGRPWVGFLHDSPESARASRDESARVSKVAKRDERHVVAEVFEAGEDGDDA